AGRGIATLTAFADGQYSSGCVRAYVIRDSPSSSDRRGGAVRTDDGAAATADLNGRNLNNGARPADRTAARCGSLSPDRADSVASARGRAVSAPTSRRRGGALPTCARSSHVYD